MKYVNETKKTILIRLEDSNSNYYWKFVDPNQEVVLDVNGLDYGLSLVMNKPIKKEDVNRAVKSIEKVIEKKKIETKRKK